MIKTLHSHGITANAYLSEPFEDLGIEIFGTHTSKLPSRAKGCSCSHLLNLHWWYNSSEEEYAIFSENDVSLETIQYWNFTWSDFFRLIPTDWNIVQLVRIDPFVSMKHQEEDGLKIRRRRWYDWGTQAYLIKRSAVRDILYRTYVHKSKFQFDPPDNMYALTENLIYCQVPDYLNTVYSVPLFLEDVNLKEHKEPDDQTESYKYYLDLWKNNTLSIQDIMVRNLMYYNGPIEGKSSPQWAASIG